ncbi:MAG: DUF481 domain-containing protein [Verrucomicrobiota bacterium]
MLHYLRYLTVALCLSAVTNLYADVLIFNNGDRLSGTLISEEDGVITFASTSLGQIQVSTKRASVQTAAEVKAEVDGPVMPGEGEQLAAAEGAPQVPEANDEQADTTAQAEEEANLFDQMISEWKETFESIIPEGWSGKIDFGYAYTNTNTRKQELVAKFKAEMKDGDHGYSLRGFYEFGDTVAQNGTKSVDTDKFGGGFRYEYDFAEDWFFFSDSDYLQDRVKAIRDQATQTLGVGYRIYNEDDLKLSVNFGGAGQYKSVVGDSKKWFYYGSVGNDFEYHFNGFFRIEQSANFRIDPSDTNAYQWYFYLAGVATLTDWIEASLSYNLDYDNTVGPGSNQLEERILASIGIPF